MSEITKLYENAGINRVCNTCELRGFKRLCPTKALCVRTNPPFTAEKQLKLIKWFMHSEHFSPIRFNVRWVVDDIASYINFLWQDLTEEEKQQVKGILK